VFSIGDHQLAGYRIRRSLLGDAMGRFTESEQYYCFDLLDKTTFEDAFESIACVVFRLAQDEGGWRESCWLA
jgi:hypothetical protein